MNEMTAPDVENDRFARSGGGSLARRNEPLELGYENLFDYGVAPSFSLTRLGSKGIGPGSRSPSDGMLGTCRIALVR